MSDNSDIMTVKEVAKYLKIKEQTAYSLCRQGKIPAVKIGGQWKVKRSHLDRWFEEEYERLKRQRDNQ